MIRSLAAMSFRNKNFRRLALPLLCVALLCATLAALTLSGCGVDPVQAAQAKPDPLKSVLAQMDAASAKFHSAEADIRKEQFERIVHDTTVETGQVYFLRTGNSVQFGGKFDPPNQQTVEYKNGVARLYSAGTNHLQEIAGGGANQSQIETFLTLGFGGSGADLAKAWTITDQGPEPISDGGKSVQTEKLDLVSKDAGVRNNFTHIDIWVDPARDVSLKQEFFAPGGDTQTAIYSNIRLNQPIDMKAFQINCKGKSS